MSAEHPPTSSAREAAVRIVRTLREAGHAAYLAGGCVRDTLLGLAPQDFDVATAARPDAVRGLFRRSKYVGEAFGVVLVRVEGHEIEVATFRAEWGYADGRRPTRVEFTDAEHDARRRDFTVNGLFEDPLLPAADPEARVIDYVGGRADLRAGLIRAIGDPEERFGEDYLRMLRAVRFAARLGFTIEERTARAIAGHARYLGQISRERIGLEARAMLGPPRDACARAEAARLAQALRLDGPMLNEEHAAPEPTALAHLPAGASYPAALAAWLLDRHLAAGAHAGGAGAATQLEPPPGLPAALERFVRERLDATLRRWRGALCLSNEHRDALQAVLLLLPRLLAWTELGVAPRKRLLASPAWAEAFDVTQALAHRPDAGPLPELMERIARESVTLREAGVAPPPWIGGDDLIALGLPPGPAFRRLLDAAYDGQLDGTLASREAALAWLREQR